MEFDVNRIPNSGFNFSFSANSEQFEINQNDCVIENPVIVKGELKLLKKEIPVGDLANPSEIANVILFLCLLQIIAKKQCLKILRNIIG